MKKYNFYFLIILFTNLIVSQSYAIPPVNLACSRQAVINYYKDPNGFESDVEKVVKKAEDILNVRVIENNLGKHKEKLAIVFDIDETSLSNFERNKNDDFASLPELIDKRYKAADSPAIKPVLRLYNRAKELGVSVFFITARKPLENQPFEDLKPYTISNLLAAGYRDWSGIYLPKEHELTMQAANYKAALRKSLSEKGYRIILNLGDQDTDFDGGYAENSIKIPNPMYQASKTPCNQKWC